VSKVGIFRDDRQDIEATMMGGIEALRARCGMGRVLEVLDMVVISDHKMVRNCADVHFLYL
jgi:hypothetical protein